MSTATTRSATSSRVFGKIAQEYDRWRPGYPEPALDWVLPAHARAVMDLGAGTGKLTSALLDRGLRVTAVDPDPDMLGVLHRRIPAAATRVACAEALPVPASSMDAILVAQAWHWFQHEECVPEIRRVLRPHGALGLLWNSFVDMPGWQRRVAQLCPPRIPMREDALENAVVDGLPRSEYESTQFAWYLQVSPGDVCNILATHSRFAVLDDDERSARLAEIATVVADACDRAQSTKIPWLHVTQCVRWRPDL